MEEERDTIANYVNVVGFNNKYGVSGDKITTCSICCPQYGGYLEMKSLKEKKDTKCL